TFTFGYVLLNCLMTAPKALASAPVQIPSKLMVPETAEVLPALAVPALDVLPSTAARATSDTIANAPTRRIERLLTIGLLSLTGRRSGGCCRDRRSARWSYRRPPPRVRPLGHGHEARSVRPAGHGGFGCHFQRFRRRLAPAP